MWYDFPILDNYLEKINNLEQHVLVFSKKLKIIYYIYLHNWNKKVLIICSFKYFSQKLMTNFVKIYINFEFSCSGLPRCQDQKDWYAKIFFVIRYLGFLHTYNLVVPIKSPNVQILLAFSYLISLCCFLLNLKKTLLTSWVQHAPNF